MKELIGKTIVNVIQLEFDVDGDGERIGELTSFQCSDNTVIHYLADGGDTTYFASVSLVTLDSNGIPEEHPDGKFV